MGLWLLILCVLCPYTYGDPPLVLDPSSSSTTTGGKRQGSSIEMGLARSAQDKKIVRNAMETKRNSGGTLKETQQAGRQMAKILQKKDDREIQRILKVLHLSYMYM